MTDKMREEFEAWAKERVPYRALKELDDEGEYDDHEVRMMWRAWQAAQSVPVVGEVVENAAKSIASMVDEWVHGGIKNNVNWQESLPALIQLRLKRYWPTTSISAAELERLRKDAERGRKANEGGLYCIAEWNHVQKEWIDLLPSTAIERVDAAIAAEGEK